MWYAIVAVVSASLSGFLCYRYGRSVEQKIVTEAVRFQAAVSSDVNSLLGGLRMRLGYLKKAL